MRENIKHPIPPFCNGNSQILILGSFPSQKSREQLFFYGHSRNRFWSVISDVFKDSLPQTVEEKKAFLTKHRIALWDVIASCDIEGSADSSIKNVVPTDLELILEKADIKMIFVNGKTAEKYYNKYQLKALGRACVCLPSTSPANAAWSLERLVEEWSVIKDLIQM